MDTTTYLSIALGGTVVLCIIVVLVMQRLLRQERDRTNEQIAKLEENLALETSGRTQSAEEHTRAQADVARLQEAVARLEANLSERDERIAAQEESITSQQTQLTHARTTYEAFKAQADTRAEQQTQQVQELERARETMKKEFRLLAEDVMRQHGAAFKAESKEQLEGVLNPLRLKLNEFQTGLSASQKEAAEGRARLEEQIKHLGERSLQITKDAQDLTRALKGDSQRQGAWGEMVLATILEKSGLREGEEYVTQESTTTDDGQRIRPDVIINLPNSHRIIIDAKVSLLAFERHVNEDSDEARASALAEHITSIKNHVRGLSAKRYETELGFTPDYVLMFVPIEGALAAALTHDPDLTQFALEQNVTLATPTNLMTLLRTVSSIWQVERRNRNAEAIADRAGKLYDKFVAFVGDLETIGTRINQTQQAHEKALGKLTSGRGNLIRQTEELKKLGARATKRIDAEHLELAGADLLTESIESDSSQEAEKNP